MTLEEGLFLFLKASTTLASLLGSAPFRVYPDVLPELIDYPAVTYQRISTRRIQTLDLSTLYPGGQLVEARMQLGIWSANVADSSGNTRSGKLDVLRVGTALVNALNGFRGNWGTVDIRSCLADADEGDRDIFENVTRSYHKVIDFMITHIEQA